MTALWDMPLSSIKAYLDHAVDTEKEQVAFDMWRGVYPEMVLEKIEFVSFKEFKAKIFAKKSQGTNKTAQQIEDELRKVIATYEGR